MKRKEYLLEKLKAYGRSGAYPFHMPGHKRQTDKSFAMDFPNPYSIDITEIDGFDNLHHPEGILRESMEWAASIYGADKTYYLVNGSSCGILSAVCGTTDYGGSILMSRNCHKSAYHAVYMNGLQAVYAYPPNVVEFGINGGLEPEKIEDMLISHREIQSVLVVSPTYDGMVADIRRIAEVVHRFGLPLVVDEAHGAHFPFGREAGFPVSALALGADIVVQSLHKTLPSFTQTAVMHVKNGFVDMDKLDRYIHIFQSSSPSYILMAGIENCIKWMDECGRKRMMAFAGDLREVREGLNGMKHLKVIPESVAGRWGIFFVDISKIVVSSRGTGMSGAELSDILREEYHLEMEMCGADYVTAITTVADTKDGLLRLCQAFCEIDRRLGNKADIAVMEKAGRLCKYPEVSMKITEALSAPWRKVRLLESVGLVSVEYIYLYPPGIPLIAPGEVLGEAFVKQILEYRSLGLPIQGMEDDGVEWIRVVNDGNDGGGADDQINDEIDGEM